MSSCTVWPESPTHDPSIMEHLRHRSLRQASQDMRFSEQDSEYHIVRIDKEQRRTYEKFARIAHDEKGLPAALTDAHDVYRGDSSRLRLMLHRERPAHTSGKADSLPFRDAVTLERVFEAMRLPPSYLQIADGALATAQVFVSRGAQSRPASFEMIVCCISKQGDWSMALSHHAATMDTSVFCSLDKQIDAQPLVNEMLGLQSHSFHPMLIPCIMFDAVMRLGITRRIAIKDKLQTLERTMARVGRKASVELALDANQDHDQQDTQDWIQLFELLNSCRKDQSSRKGRYEFWRSYHAAIQAGLDYFREVLVTCPNDAYLEAHQGLEQWVCLTWQKLNSLIARDKDHINRVEYVSTLLYNLVQQRDIRLQSSIARATQRDSQDMKFISVLGSVFLPASLIATILNVPGFQFLPGPQLFGVYLGITLPLIAFVVLLCMSRSRWSKWRFRVGRRLPPIPDVKYL